MRMICKSGCYGQYTEGKTYIVRSIRGSGPEAMVLTESDDRGSKDNGLVMGRCKLLYFQDYLKIL